MYVVVEPTPVLLSEAPQDHLVDDIDFRLSFVFFLLSCPTNKKLTLAYRRKSGTVTVPSDCGPDRTPGVYDAFDPKLLKEWSPNAIKFMSFHAYIRKLQVGRLSLLPPILMTHFILRQVTRVVLVWSFRSSALP